MKVELQISADIDEPYIVIHTSKITPEINQLMELFQSSGNVITVTDNDQLIVLERLLSAKKICFRQKALRNGETSRKWVYEDFQIHTHQFKTDKPCRIIFSRHNACNTEKRK